MIAIRLPKSCNIPLFSSDLCKLNSKIIFPDVIDENASVLFKVGTEQYNNFSQSRFIYGE